MARSRMNWALPAALCCLAASFPGAADPAVEFRKGDRICIIGNTFAERLRHSNYFETLLTASYPDLGLTFRNMGWSADELTLQPRPLDFGDIKSHLARQEADVVFMCYGFNESFQGAEGLADFEANLGAYLDDFLAQRFNGESAPRLVVVSPMPQEQIGLLPDPADRNVMIARYCAVMDKVTAEKGVAYMDIFHPILELRKDNAVPSLTFNGIHLHDRGAWIVAQVMMDALHIDAAAPRVRIDAAARTAQAEDASVSDIAARGSGLTFRLTEERLPAPAAPEGVPVESQLAAWTPVVAVTGLAPGQYALMRDGTIIAVARNEVWRAGVAIEGTAGQAQAAAMRETIAYKNGLYFDRWRAVNGYYIYGGRKEPFGVISFPPEMQRYDERVAELDGKIAGMAAERPSSLYELVQIDE